MYGLSLGISLSLTVPWRPAFGACLWGLPLGPAFGACLRGLPSGPAFGACLREAGACSHRACLRACLRGLPSGPAFGPAFGPALGAASLNTFFLYFLYFFSKSFKKGGDFASFLSSQNPRLFLTDFEKKKEKKNTHKQPTRTHIQPAELIV